MSTRSLSLGRPGPVAADGFSINYQAWMGWGDPGRLCWDRVTRGQHQDMGQCFPCCQILPWLQQDRARCCK